MRFIIAYYLMLLYVTFMLKPLIPVISDVLSHSFEEAYHVSTVHAKYGANHLETELANSASSDNDNSKNQNTTKQQEETTVVHLCTEVDTYDFSLNSINKIYYPFVNNNLTEIFISKHSPPPKFSC